VSTFVSVGNARQPFVRLLDAVVEIADKLPKPLIVQHGHTPFSYKGCEAYDFIEMDEYLKLINDSKILIFHAGAGSIISALHAGKIPIVMPRLAELGEHVNNHQLELTNALASINKVIAVKNKEELENAVRLNTAHHIASSSGTDMIRIVAKTLNEYSNSLRISDRV
jgi:beta-1,4-N-acetylglucosaminyltransferase